MAEVFNEDGTLKTKEIGYLTISKSVGHRYNAVLYSGLSAEAFATLAEAEKELKLYQTNVWRPSILEYTTGSNMKTNDITYTFEPRRWLAIPDSEFKKTWWKLVRSDVLPDREYRERVKKAASLHGQNFLKDFLSTTFLADRTTTLQETEDLYIS